MEGWAHPIKARGQGPTRPLGRAGEININTSNSFPEEYRFLCLLVLKLAACARLNGCFFQAFFTKILFVLAFFELQRGIVSRGTSFNPTWEPEQSHILFPWRDQNWSMKQFPICLVTIHKGCLVQTKFFLCFSTWVTSNLILKPLRNILDIRYRNHLFPIRQCPPLTLSGSSPFQMIACLIPYREGS